MAVKNTLVENVYTCEFSVGQPISFQHKKLQKAKINTSKGKINFLQCRRRRQCRYLYLDTKIQVQKIECKLRFH